jgi:hypothetical protein
MDLDTDLFVQGFWAKCRETIRPELDLLVSQLQDHGYEVNVSSQEYSAGEPSAADAAPSLRLSLHKPKQTVAAYLQFRGDVNRKIIEVTSSLGMSSSFELADLDLPKVKGLLSDWLAKLP